MELLNAHDYRRKARSVLPRGVFEYIDRGSEDETALTRLRASLDRVKLQPTILTGATNAGLGTEIFGRNLTAPLVIAPTALAGLVAFEGEAKLARAAASVGIPYCVATQSITPIEAIRAAAPEADLWFQLYVWEDLDLTKGLLDRAWGCGCTCLVVTVDNQVAPNREYNQRNGFSMPIVPTVRNLTDVALHPRWMLGVLARYLVTSGMPGYAHYPEEYRRSISREIVAGRVRMKAGLSWDDIRAIRGLWPGRLILKGVLSVEDAERAAAAGVDGIVVSSHGGRNLDTTPDPADCLPAVSDAVSTAMCILADSGVQRGTDVLKYRAMGATAVMIGRLPLWGLAVGGERGAEDILRMLLREMQIAMGYLGAADFSGVKEFKPANPNR